MANKYSNRFIHLFTFVCDFEPLCEIQPQRLCAIGENMEGDLGTIQKTEIRNVLLVDLRTLPLHVGDEPLEECGSFNLVDNVSTWSIMFQPDRGYLDLGQDGRDGMTYS